MRPIKYRAFYKGEMRRVTALEWIHEGEDLAGCYLTGIDKCVIVNNDETNFGVDLLAFTGLTDRNGTEIYEGDSIVATGGVSWNGINEFEDWGYVEWKGAAFYLYNQKDEWLLLNDLIRHSEIEITGNKFENPELLEGE